LNKSRLRALPATPALMPRSPKRFQLPWRARSPETVARV
jgi:hypothetical protein